MATLILQLIRESCLKQYSIIVVDFDLKTSNTFVNQTAVILVAKFTIIGASCPHSIDLVGDFEPLPVFRRQLTRLLVGYAPFVATKLVGYQQLVCLQASQSLLKFN